MEDKLLDLIDKFDQGKLFIDINVNRNPQVWQDIAEVASILDRYSSVAPFTGDTWSDYAPEKVSEWQYLSVQDHSGTASEGVSNGAKAILTKDFLAIANVTMAQIAEEFESVF